MSKPAVSPYSDTIWNEIEVADRQTVEAIQRRKLKEQTEYLAAHSLFYQQKAADSGIELAGIDSHEKLGEFPFTEKQELRDSLAWIHR